MSHNICVVTSTRAEYGLLKNIIKYLKFDSFFNLKLIVTGSHLCESQGYTINEILEDGYTDCERIEIPMDAKDSTTMSKSMGDTIKIFSDCFDEYKPELIIILGDRFEACAIAMTAFVQGIPIAHISGGDVTEGALDDGFRHCITKISAIHFPGCDDSAKRVIQMGENPNNVYSVGDTGVENCISTEFWTLERLNENLGLNLIERKYAVVTFHPVTQEKDSAEKQVYELIKAMETFKNISYIITMSNVDAEGDLINDIWKKESVKHDNWLLVNSLGMVRYLSAVKHSGLVLGNSSSGIVEAPALGIPTVNIGDRQKGRPLADSIICCEPVYGQIKEAIDLSLTDSFYNMAQNVIPKFKGNNASKKIVEIIKNRLKHNDITVKKTFYNL